MFFRSPTSSAPPGIRLYAIGDIHGRLDLLKALLEKIEADSAAIQNAVQLIFLGDYIDRGILSRSVIDRLIALQTQKTPVPIFIMGNHEQMFIRILRDTDAALAVHWLGFGGRETAMSYGVSPPLHANEADMTEFVVALRNAVPAAHREFLDRLETKVSFGDYFFCHAGIRPGVPLAEQAENDLLWIRDEFLHYRKAHEKIIVHGHTIVPEPDVTANRIGIDTGAYATGNLTALALEDRKRWFLHTI